MMTLKLNFEGDIEKETLKWIGDVEAVKHNKGVKKEDSCVSYSLVLVIAFF